MYKGKIVNVVKKSKLRWNPAPEGIKGYVVSTYTNYVEHADKDNIYQAFAEQIYLIKREDKYIPVGVWNFMEQEMKEPEQSESGIFLERSASEVELHGHAVIINDWMKEQGVKEGDRVI